ncbi:leucine-rich repeat domain-containing protein [Desulfococcaceae bacterium HSG8]|nr:leucine-rich repeat domain-containing protein [Desulfococcaceae bacterium HSG8]
MKKSTVLFVIFISGLFYFGAYQPARAAEQTVLLTVPGCDASGADSGISSILSGIDGVTGVSVDTSQLAVTVVYDDTKTGADQMETSLNNDGYTVENIAYSISHTDVAAQEAKNIIDTDNDLIILDVREPDEYCGDGNHIPGAVNYPWNSDVLRQKYGDLSVNDSILVVCGSGIRSNHAAEFMDSMSFTAVYDMTGGMKAWNWETEDCTPECMNPRDADSDNKVGLPDIIFGLQYLSGLTDGGNKPDLQDIIFGLQILSGMKPCDTLISEIAFADPALRSCVLETGAAYAGEVTSLACQAIGISDISGIEHLTGLEELNLFLNNISDVNVLADLTGLTYLELGRNNITDVSPLGSLTNLTILFLSNNSISDISALGSLTSLTKLDLMENNGITDVSAFANLTDLTFLALNRNRISDLSGLANLTKLTDLLLYMNDISDVSPLANLTNLAVLNLNNNNISTGVAELVTLTNAADIQLLLNSSIPCTDLDALETALGEEVVSRPETCVYQDKLQSANRKLSD